MARTFATAYVRVSQTRHPINPAQLVCVGCSHALPISPRAGGTPLIIPQKIAIINHNSVCLNQVTILFRE